MRKAAQAWTVATYNFRQWRRNPRIVVTFALALVLCFLLSNKAVRFAQEQETILQLVEPFVWTFGDANNILISSLLLVLLFADMPFICEGTPFYLMRTRRSVWLWGQIVYVSLATLLYIAFILIATCALCAHLSFVGNQWSETAAMLGYSGIGQEVALPAFVKTLEMSTPYECMGTIFLLMLVYTLLMTSVMLAVNIRRGQFWGVVSVFLFSLFGLLMNPQVFGQMLGLPEELMYKANVAVGWLSPLNQATYHMHNFGYDLLPRMWQTFLIFGAAILILFWTALRGMKKYNFNFMGSGA